MAGQETSILERLCKAESPSVFHDWEEQEGYYIGACRASIEDAPRLIDIAIKWSDPDWPDYLEEVDVELDDDFDLLPVTAWRTLADLKSSAAVEPLIDMLCELDDEFDDWTTEELPQVFAKIGKPAIEPLFRLAKDAGKLESARSIAIMGLRRVANSCEGTRDPIVADLTEIMVNATEGTEDTENNVEFNSTLLAELVELQAVGAAEAIERAFANDLLDVGMIGDWEMVRRELGVEGLGLDMPEDPYNSLKDLRKRMGIGVFSDKVMFSFGEIDEEAEQAYYERAWDVFSKSNEAQQVVDRDGDLGWFRMLLEFGLRYLGETADQMTVASVSGFVLGHIPRKVSAEPERAGSVVFELTMFWEYLDRVFELPEAKSIVEWLKMDDLVATLETQLSDESNYGMAKSIVMLSCLG